MGRPDECKLCGEELEEWEWEYYTENGKRAGRTDICKDCLLKIKEALEELK